MQQADYHARLEQAVLLLEGKHQSLCQELQEKMEAAAEELRFERAAEYRDRLRAIELLGQKQLVTAGTMVPDGGEGLLCSAALYQGQSDG